jgi:hypothetical protein
VAAGHPAKVAADDPAKFGQVATDASAKWPPTISPGGRRPSRQSGHRQSRQVTADHPAKVATDDPAK